MARAFGKVLGLVVSISIIAVFICAFGKEGNTGGRQPACNSSNRCWEVNASGVPAGAPLRYAYDCGIKQPVSLSLTATQNEELFRLNPHLKSLWDGPYKTTQTNRMFGTAHGGTHDPVTLPSELSPCQLGSDDITWTPDATNGGKPGYLVLNTDPLLCNKDCCNAIKRYAKNGYMVSSRTIADRVLGTILGQQGCPPYDANTIQFNIRN